MNQKSNFLKSVTGSLAAAFLAVAMSGVAFWSANRTLEVNRQIAEELETLNVLKAVDSALKDTERLQRQYLLTDDKEVFKVFRLRMIGVAQEMRRLQALLKDKPDTQAAAKRLEAYSIRQLRQLRQGIKLRQTTGVEAAIDRSPLLLLEEGTLLLQEVEVTQTVELRQKQRAVASTATQAMATFILGTLLTLGIFCGSTI